jgi:hypothetical protein
MMPCATKLPDLPTPSEIAFDRTVEVVLGVLQSPACGVYGLSNTARMTIAGLVAARLINADSHRARSPWSATDSPAA